MSLIDAAPPEHKPRADALTSCMRCGYRLTGLPAAGRCPECGAEYVPQDETFLLGVPRGTTAILGHEPLRHALGRALALLLLGVASATVGGHAQGGPPFAPLVFVFILAPKVAVAPVQAVAAMAGALLRVHLGPTGVRRAASARVLAAATWIERCSWIAFAALAVWTFGLRRLPSDLRLRASIATAFIGVGFVVALAFRHRVLRPRRTASSTAQPAPGASQVLPLLDEFLDWSSVGDVSLTPGRPGRARLRIETMKPVPDPASHRPRLRAAIDAEFELNQEELAALGDRIRKWRGVVVGDDCGPGACVDTPPGPSYIRPA